MLNSVGAEDEVGERSVCGDRLSGMASLREINDRGRIFRRSVLVAFEGEVDEKAGGRVAAQRAPSGSVNEALAAAHEIVGQFARVFQKRIGFDVDDLELRRPGASSQRERDNRRCGATRANPPIFLPQSETTA